MRRTLEQILPTASARPKMRIPGAPVVTQAHPRATTLREIHSASLHDIGGACFHDGRIFGGARFDGLEVLDRVGSGDAFAAALIYGIMSGENFEVSTRLATASAALSLTSPGDGSSATREEIRRAAESPELAAIR